MKLEAPVTHHFTRGLAEGEQETSLEDAIHTLAQPLTALSFVLDLASLHSDAESWRQAVETGRVECRRAIAALKQVREAATPSMQYVEQGTTGPVG